MRCQERKLVVSGIGGGGARVGEVVEVPWEGWKGEGRGVWGHYWIPYLLYVL